MSAAMLWSEDSSLAGAVPSLAEQGLHVRHHEEFDQHIAASKATLLTHRVGQGWNPDPIPIITAGGRLLKEDSGYWSSFRALSHWSDL